MYAKQFRDKARSMLKGKTALALTVSLVLMAAAVLVLILSDSVLYLCGVLDYESGVLVPTALAEALPVLIGFLIMLAAAWLLLAAPLQLGKAGWFFSFAAGRYPSVERMFYAFDRKEYPRCVGMSVRLFLRKLLWYLPCCLPGLFLSGWGVSLGLTGEGTVLYSGGVFLTGIGAVCAAALCQRYFLSRYLLATSEQVTEKEAIRLSVDMMKGHKSDLFALRFSFLGWFLLAVPTVGLSLIYTIPYYNTTMGIFGKYCLDQKAGVEQKKTEIV